MSAAVDVSPMDSREYVSDANAEQRQYADFLTNQDVVVNEEPGTRGAEYGEFQYMRPSTETEEAEAMNSPLSIDLQPSDEEITPQYVPQRGGRRFGRLLENRERANTPEEMAVELIKQCADSVDQTRAWATREQVQRDLNHNPALAAAWATMSQEDKHRLMWNVRSQIVAPAQEEAGVQVFNQREGEVSPYMFFGEDPIRNAGNGTTGWLITRKSSEHEKGGLLMAYWVGDNAHQVRKSDAQGHSEMVNPAEINWLGRAVSLYSNIETAILRGRYGAQQ